jgi:hypothetical protein
MTSSTFQPYGLITNRLQESLYHRAHIANFYSGIADPKEYETSALVGDILNNEFTSSENFTVSSQYPPAPESSLRVDYAVRYLEQGTFKIRILLIDEDKRAKRSEKFSLKALEKQAKDYCAVCLESESDMPWVYSITAAGAHVRLWKYTREDKLVPFWGSNSAGDWSQYKDVGNDQHGQDIRYWFEQMKSLPPTPHAGQSSHTYAATGSGYQASSASASYQAPIGHASSSYTVPIFKQDPGSVYSRTEPGGGKTSSPSEKGSPGDESKEPFLPADAVYVEVQVEPKKRGDLYHFYHDGNHYTIGEGDWVECTTEHTGARYDCVAYRESGLCFYTWNLRDLQLYKEASTSAYQAPASTQARDSSGQDTQQDPKVLIVTVRVEPHRTSKDEIIFTNTRGIETSTVRSQWDKIKYNGKTAWQHEGKRHTYICFDRVFD